MKIRMLAVMLALVVFPAVVFGQMPGRGQRWGAGAEGRGCSPVATIELSPAQQQAIQALDAQFRDGILQRWQELTVKRHELQAVLRDPEAEEPLIRGKSMEMIELQNDIHRQLLAYQMEVRKILKPDQIRRWCAWTDSLFFGKHRRGMHGAQ